ncbi:hypothetical protein Tco_0492828 [Tanacetum coccineum]
MSTQQDIYDDGPENCPPMLNKDNYVPLSSCLLHYAKSKPNWKLLVNSILHVPHVRRMIVEPGDLDCDVPVAEPFHEQTDDELTKKEAKQMEANDQEIQTILMGLPEDIYAAEKEVNLFNEWENFKSTEGESIESYYLRFAKLMNDFKRNKHFPKNIASNLKFLNNLQPEWKRHVTIVHQTKDLHEVRQNAVQNPAVRAKGNGNGNNGNQIMCYNYKGLDEEFDLMAVTSDINEIEQVNANCILMANLQQALTSEEQYTKLLKETSEPHLVQQDDSNVILVDSSIAPSGGELEQHPATVKETYKDDHPAVYDFKETLQLAQESHLRMKQLNKGMKPENYARINKLSKVFVSQKDKLHEELYFLNTSKTASVSNTVSKPILIPKDGFLDNASSPSVAWKFLNEVKDTIMTLQRVVKSKMSFNVNNWLSIVHQEVHKILKDEITPIVNQVKARVIHFEKEFLKEAAKFI